jgi:hypothetical protein
MNRATPQMRSLAKRLMELESRGDADSARAFPVIETLAPHLATLVGRGGVRAVLARALTLASAEVPSLQAAKVGADGELEDPDSLRGGLGDDEFFEGRVVLLAQLLGLLVAFIGPGLASTLLREIWPQISVKPEDFGKEFAS